MTANADDIELVCDQCGDSFDVAALRGMLFQPEVLVCSCGTLRRLRNLTDRDGNPIDRDDT